ncbi:hypothetical protein EDC19_1788 [Natranaerovirga hydrolytica]|uniref:Bacterial Ig-like domain-containing protein n=1 Tax=Natranaerovirga hydrolytica TaxID=680378 RepID=A0A4R1MJG8_9FIRM|nr:immunoglobulin-like domain-containing protein [Natranaerovirga hydrolytica]TCK92637.1 hypothetical protein EDC19_1788 [Natranaerovirga hydrolytica]
MKKSYIIIILVTCISILALFAVKHFYHKHNVELSIAGDGDVKICIQDDILLKSTEALLITIKNVNKETMAFGLDYEIQIKNNGTWLQYYKPENIDDPLISLSKGESYEKKFIWMTV